MPYETMVIEVMDRVIQLANSQVSRRMWYQIKNACPYNSRYIDSKGRCRVPTVTITIVVHILRELGFKVRRKYWAKGKTSKYYFLIDLEDLMNS